MNNPQGEIELDLKDIFKKVLKKWRLLVIAMLVCVLCLSAYATVSSVIKHHQAQAALAQQIANGGPAEGEKEVVVPKIVWFSATQVVLGAFLGAAIVGIYVLVPYVTSRTLRVRGDLSSCFGLYVLGTVYLPVTSDKPVNGLDRWIDKLFTGETRLDAAVNTQIICTDIALAARKAGLTRLYVTGNCNPIAAESVVKYFRANITDIEISYENLAIHNAAALENMLGAQGIVLFEQIGRSCYADIAKELEYCKRYEIPTLGCVAVDTELAPAASGSRTRITRGARA